jgi:hypothetical protein
VRWVGNTATTAVGEAGEIRYAERIPDLIEIHIDLHKVLAITTWDLELAEYSHICLSTAAQKGLSQLLVKVFG